MSAAFIEAVHKSSFQAKLCLAAHKIPGRLSLQHNTDKTLCFAHSIFKYFNNKGFVNKQSNFHNSFYRILSDLLNISTGLDAESGITEERGSEV